MKNGFFILLITLFLSGCATISSTYYTDPNSPGYTQSAFYGLCQNCNRTFSFSKQQYDQLENVQCCYCGYTQNLKMAYNRYAYWKQQQDAYENQQFTNSINNALIKMQQEAVARREKRLEEFNKPGSFTNPIHIKVDDY